MPKISAMPTATVVNLTDIVSIVQNGVTKKATVSLWPTSAIQQALLDAKANLASPTFTGTVSGITASMVGLGNVNNTSDANKPVSTATQTALDLKANIASPTFTGTVAGITKSMVGLGNVDNTSDANKPVSTATQTALNAKLALAGGTMTGKIVLDGDPSSALHPATKQYVDGLLGGTGKKSTVRAATTANITIASDLNNADTLDGVALVNGDLVLVKNQTLPEENGVYVVGAVPARHSDFNSYDEHVGALIVVSEGSTNDNTLWIGTSNAGGVLGTTAIAFGQTSTQGALLASNNLSDLASASTARTNLGLGNVTNTSDANKPVSTAQQAALDLKAPLASPTFTGTVAGITKSMVGLGNVDNTSDANKPVSTATQTALDLKGSLAGTNLWTAAQTVQQLAVAYGATITPNASTQNNKRTVLSGNVTFANPSNLTGKGGWMMNYEIIQDATGNRVATWGSKYKFPGGSAVLSTTANAKDMLTCQYDETADVLLCTLTKDFS